MPFLLSPVLALLACATPAVSQSDEAARLREELVKARLEVFDLKLRLARLAGKPEEEMKTLVDGLKSEQSEVGVAALRELAKLSDERRRSALAEVLARLPAAPESVKAQAVAFLGLLAHPDAAAAVARAAQDPSPAVRMASASALKASTTPAALKALLGLLKDPLPDVRIAALDALGVAKREEAVEPILALAASETHAAAQEKAIDALGAIGSGAAVEPLLRLMETTERLNVRWSCINSLGQIGDPTAAPRLRPFLDPSRTLTTRQVTIEALGRLRDAASVPALAKILVEEKEEKLRERAAAAIGLIPAAAGAEEALLKAYFEDLSELVRRAAWAALTAAAGDRFDANERLIQALLGRGKRSEADTLCARLHALKPDEAGRARAVALEEKVAAAAFDAGDAKSALVHYRQLLTLAPERSDALRRVAACYRELKDAESRVKTLRDLELKLAKGEGVWWDVRLEILSILEAGRDPEAAVEEANALLSLNSPPHPDERRRALELSLRSSTIRLLTPLQEANPGARQETLDAVRRLGKKILPALAAEAESARGPLPAVVEAANLITQSTVDPSTADPAKLRDAAASWRQWLARN